MSLRKQMISGLGWTFAQQFGTQGITFLVSIILARLLLPAEFGLIGMIALFMTIGNTLINAGLTTSLIRTKDADHEDYSTVFMINLAGSMVVYLLLFVTAPLIADFFRQPQLTAIIRVYTIAFIINAFSSVQLTRLTKEMQFKTQLTVQIPSLVLSSVLGIYLAWTGHGVWALVWMYIAQAFLSAVQLWFRTGWRPGFSFNKQKFRYHFNFGYKLLLSGLIDAVYVNIYNLIIGRMYPAAQLGYYTRALNMRQLPVQNLATALNKVAFPALSKLQDDNEKLRRAYKQIMQQVIFWVAPTLIVLAVMAEPLFVLLFTEKWLPAVPYFQLLCIPGIFYPLHSYNLNILNVKGRSDLFLKLEVIKKAFITIGILIAIPFGIYGLLYFQIIANVFGYVVNTWYSGKMINYSAGAQLRDILPIIILAVLTGGLIFILDWYIMVDWSNILRLAVGGIIYFGIYLGFGLIIRFAPLLEFKKIVLKR